MPEFPFSKWVGLGLLVGTLFRFGFDSDKYLTDISIIDGKVELKWLTTFLKQKTAEYKINEISKWNLLKRNFLLREFNQLEIEGDFSKMKFSLINNETKEKVKKIAVHNTVYSK